jgi:hypothetical protein
MEGVGKDVCEDGAAATPRVTSPEATAQLEQLERDLVDERIRAMEGRVLTWA